MDLSTQQLQQALGGRIFRFYEQIDSTQNSALGWLRQDAPHGALVTADEQISGRGRQGRGWHNPPGVNIAMSIILHPAPEHLWQMTLLGAVSMTDLLRELGADNIALKWPNDVRLNGRKICGILPEAVWDGDALRGVVLGVGINIRADFRDTPLAETAASLEIELGRPLHRADIIAQFLACLDRRWAQLTTPQLFDDWRSQLETIGQPVTIDFNGQRLSGVAEGVDHDGALLVRRADGTLERALAGDVILGIS